MSYAIVEAGGVQLRVEPGRFYDINRLHAEVDETYTIDKVLLVNNDGEITVGQPLIAEAKVEGTIVSHLRGRKVLVYKMKPKKKTRKKRGHRQELTRLMIDSISINGTVLASSEEAEETPVEDASATAATVDATPETVEASSEEE
ncbi:MAG: 50S ribosomal protein L21 [Cyanobacteriota bacterium]|nr:50S ribosomal protein L21 [Cyanobacteriota bacterium]